jgi:ABC-type nitrate/sulfonate/bicarbonate transport system substrate-binding protein
VPFDVAHVGEIVAAREGLFERAGLRVALTRPDGGYDPIAAVTRGDDIFGVTDSKSFLVARAKGAPLVAFGAGYLESPIVLFALEQAEIRNLQDLVGKRVAREPGSDAAIIYDALLAKAGLSRGEMREVNGQAGIEALSKRAIDVLPGPVAALSYALDQQGIPYTVVRPSDYGIHVPGTVYFTTEKFAREHPSAVERFLKAVIAGWQTTYADEAKSVALIVAAGEGALTVDQVRLQLAAQRDFVRPPARRFAEFDSGQWKQLRLILQNARLLDESVNLSRAVNYDFLKEAYRKPVTFGNERTRGGM